MAPEVCKQIMGQGRGYSGAKADVWSLGVTVVEMMLGGHPWKKMEGLQAIWQVRSEWGSCVRMGTSCNNSAPSMCCDKISNHKVPGSRATCK